MSPLADVIRRALPGVAAVMLAVPPVQAAVVQCPATLSVEQHPGAVPPGWRALDASRRHDWTNAQFSDGPPEQEAWLAPDRTNTKSGKTFTNVWTFGRSAAGIWLSCAYTGTSVIVSSRLPDGVKTCEIRYDSYAVPPVAEAIDCR